MLNLGSESSLRNQTLQIGHTYSFIYDKKRVCVYLKTPHKLLINNWARSDNFTMEKLPCSQVMKANIAIMGLPDKLYFLMWCTKDTMSLLCCFCQKSVTLTLLMQKYQAYPTWGAFCETASLHSSEVLVSYIKDEVWETSCSRLMETKEWEKKMYPVILDEILDQKSKLLEWLNWDTWQHLRSVG